MKPFTLTRGALLAAALTILHAPAALAAGGESTPLHLGSAVRAAHAGSSTGSSLTRTIVGLFVVIAVIYGVTWVLRQVKGGRARSTGGSLSSVASLPLGSNRSLALVRVGRELVLLGVAEHAITAIRTYSEEEALNAEIDGVDGEQGATPAAPGGSRRLGETLRRMTVRS